MLIWLPWAFSLSTASPCCHRKCSQASNRKFITVKLTSVISIFTHCAKCFYVYVKPFLELIFNVYVHFHCFPPSSQIIKLPPPPPLLFGGGRIKANTMSVYEGEAYPRRLSEEPDRGVYCAHCSFERVRAPRTLFNEVGTQSPFCFFTSRRLKNGR